MRGDPFHGTVMLCSPAEGCIAFPEFADIISNLSIMITPVPLCVHSVRT